LNLVRARLLPHFGLPGSANSELDAVQEPKAAQAELPPAARALFWRLHDVVHE